MNILNDFDNWLFDFFNSFAGASEFWDAVFVALAEYVIFLLIAGLCVFVLMKRSRERLKITVKALIAALIARGILVSIIRFLWFRPRPFLQEGVVQLVSHDPMEGSFPSGHAAFMFGLAFTLLFVDKRWGAAYLLFAAVSGMARVVTGVHYPMDIVGGMMIGTLAAYATQWLFRHFASNFRFPA